MTVCFSISLQVSLIVLELSDASSLIRSGIGTQDLLWADLGAGTGLFTQALMDILSDQARVHALDKSPRYLYDLWREHKQRLVVHDGDFTRDMELPLLDGILMANALHYVKEKEGVMKHILSYLKEGGRFLLVEYNSDRPNPPWVPYPISYGKWEKLGAELGLEGVEKLGSLPSRYGYQGIYASIAHKRL